MFEVVKIILYILLLVIWIPVFMACSPLWMTVILVMSRSIDEFKDITKHFITRVSLLKVAE